MDRLGEKIRERRNLKNLTLRELSSKIGISLSTLQKIEKGVLSPSVHLMIDICHELDTPLYTFIRDKKKVFIHIRKADQRELIKSTVEDKRIKMMLIADYGLISDDINVSFLDVKKGGGMKPHTEPCFVFTYVLKGKIIVEYNGTMYQANEGDAVYYDGSFTHRTQALADSQLFNIYINK